MTGRLGKIFIGMALAVGAGVTTLLPAGAQDPSWAPGSVAGVAFNDLDHDGVQESGEPVFAGHSIYLLTAGGANWLGQTTTDAAGRYSFGGLGPGTYRVAYNSSTWNSMRNDWFPTTAALASPPWQELVVDGAEQVDWGFRAIVRSTDVNTPISQYVGPSGLTVQSYVDVVPAQAVHDALATGLLGPEAQYVTVRFGLGSTSTTSSSTAQVDGRYVSFNSVSGSTYLAWASGGGSWTTVAHEYGHAWSDYHQAMTQQTSTWDRYLQARGLAGDSRVGSSYAWMPAEMIAEDYRQLLGPPSSQTSPQMNRDIPLAADVAGLRDFLANEFTTAPTGAAPAPAPAPDTTAPSSTLVTPTSGATVSGTVTVVATAADDQTAAGGLQVTVVVDGTAAYPAVFDATTGSYRAQLDSTKFADGAHSIVAVARDAAGNSTTSAAVSTTIQNARKKTGSTSKPRR